jgi:YidC/Oxa1 family membrane protein insertase
VVAPAPPPVEAVAAADEQRVVLENSEFRMELTNRGAEVVSFALKKHREIDGKPVELVRAREGFPYPLGLVGADQQPLPLEGALFAVERNGDAPDVTFRYAGPLGRAHKRVHLTPDGFFEVEIGVPGQTGWSIVLGPGMRNPLAEERKSRFSQRSAVYRVGGEVSVIDAQSAKGDVEVPGAGLDWVGVEDTYFLTAVLPESPVARIVVRPLLEEQASPTEPYRFTPLPPKDQMTGAQKDLARDLEVTVASAGDQMKLKAFWGGKNYGTLAAQGYGLEKTISQRWGTFRILVAPLLAGLNWIYAHVVQNYGWAIILMTVLIKIVLLPLTHKSYVSMKRMQELNPRMQAIRDRWRPKLKDRKGRPDLEAQRKMNEEINALFRSEGVNPAGGCLPMLLQLPLLYAFYNLLSTAIELRGAPWLGWIHDLSHYDPYYVLPIVMGAAQLLQQRMMPGTSDPVQRKVFMLMPVFFTVLFLQFPTGLVLYWLVNNVLTIAQQAVYEHLKTRRAVATA